MNGCLFRSFDVRVYFSLEFTFGFIYFFFT